MKVDRKVDMASGICESCGLMVEPRNLYVDIILDSYSLQCPVCFYRRNAKDVAGYYQRVKKIIPDVYDKDEFNKHKLDVTAIGDAILMAGEITDAAVKQAVGNELAKEYFESLKMSSKFKFKSSRYAFQTTKTVEGQAVQLLMLKAVVQFKSYLEFLEHELYKKFRLECGTIFD